MDFFNSLWEDPAQREIPRAENFAEDITNEKWMSQSSTYKLISGTLKHPHEWRGINKYFIGDTKKSANVSTDQHASTARRQVISNKRNKIKTGNATKTGDEESEEDSDNDTESQADPSFNECHQYVPGLRKNPCIDKFSCMDTNEHAECLALFLRFSMFKGGAIMPADRSEHLKFEVIYKKVQEEQAAFSEDALTQWAERAKDIQTVSEAQIRVFQTIYMLKAKKALEFYPHVYKRRLMVPLLPGDIKVEMIKMSDLLQMGRIPAFFHPPLAKRTKVNTMISKLLQSTQYNLQPDQVVGSLHKLPVSFDPNAESLARLHKAQVVISSGALNTLLETYFDFSKVWALPITVKVYRTIEKGKTMTKTIVFIDKPLPKQTVTANEYHRFVFKHGAKVRLTQRKHNSCFTFPVPGVDPLEKEFASTSNDSTDGNLDDPSQKSEKIQTNNAKEEYMETDAADDCDDDRLIINEESLPETSNLNVNNQSQPRPSNSNAPAPSTNTSVVTRSQSKRQEPFKRKDGLKLPKTPDGFTAPISQTNVTYSSWVIRPENDNQLSVHQKTALKEITVIVRCQVDACQKVSGDMTALSVSPKPEYQLEFAAEEPTKDELLREWVSLFFKPVSQVVRVRVDVKEEEIIMCEKKDKLQIAADAQRMHGVRLSDSLQTLYSVFSEVSSLSKGSYLLSHSPEQNVFASLEESVDSDLENSKSVRNLKTYFDQKVSVSFDPRLAWRKLDCTLVLPRHQVLKVMPATYRPKPCGITFKARNIASKQKKGNDQKRPAFLTTKKKKKKKNKNKNKKKKTPDT